jgi:hypothetical protein
VVTEIALAVVLLAGAGLMLRSLTRLQNTSPGFIADGVLHLEINPTYKRQEDYRVELMSRPTTICLLSGKSRDIEASFQSRANRSKIRNITRWSIIKPSRLIISR